MNWEYGLDGMLQEGTVGKVLLYKQGNKIWLRPIMTQKWSVRYRPDHIQLEGLPGDLGREAFLRSLEELGNLDRPMVLRVLGPRWPQDMLEGATNPLWGTTIGCSMAACLDGRLYLAGNAYFKPVKRWPQSWHEFLQWLSSYMACENDRTDRLDTGGPTGPPVHIALVQRCIRGTNLRLVADDMIVRQDINYYITGEEE